jgi:hypothetical protein
MRRKFGIQCGDLLLPLDLERFWIDLKQNRAVIAGLVLVPAPSIIEAPCQNNRGGPDISAFTRVFDAPSARLRASSTRYGPATTHVKALRMACLSEAMSFQKRPQTKRLP